MLRVDMRPTWDCMQERLGASDVKDWYDNGFVGFRDMEPLCRPLSLPLQLLAFHAYGLHSEKEEYDNEQTDVYYSDLSSVVTWAGSWSVGNVQRMKQHCTLCVYKSCYSSALNHSVHPLVKYSAPLLFDTL